LRLPRYFALLRGGAMLISVAGERRHL
jgi:hypothetical protein